MADWRGGRHGICEPSTVHVLAKSDCFDSDSSQAIVSRIKYSKVALLDPENWSTMSSDSTNYLRIRWCRIFSYFLNSPCNFLRILPVSNLSQTPLGG